MSNSLRDLIDDRADLDDEEEDGSFAGDEDGDEGERRPRPRRPELDDSSEEDEDDEDEEEAAKVSHLKLVTIRKPISTANNHCGADSRRIYCR